MINDRLKPSRVVSMWSEEQLGEGYLANLDIEHSNGSEESIYLLFTEEHYNNLRWLVSKMEEDMEGIL